MKILMLALCMTMVACGGGSDAARDETKVESEEVEKEGVFDPLIGSLDKANAVEQQVLAQKDRLDQAIDDSDGSEDKAED